MYKNKIFGIGYSDILKVSMSSRGNKYILVAQDYFSKWQFVRAMPDQKTDML